VADGAFRDDLFAFVTLDTREGAHPFTIASAWKSDGHVMFGTKALGDFTRDLPNRLKVGGPIVVEGPYGGFDYADASARQIWVAGGVGLTPFVARLEELAARGGTDRPVDLFYSTRKADPEILERLSDIAEAAGVTLHVTETSSGGALTDAQLREVVNGSF